MEKELDLIEISFDKVFNHTPYGYLVYIEHEGIRKRMYVADKMYDPDILIMKNYDEGFCIMSIFKSTNIVMHDIK